jgi:putative Holliday junction resolvase
LRILAIDFGEKNIGLAKSDALEISAQGLETLRSADLETSLERLAQLIKEEQIEEVVVGLPVNMDGTRGRQSEIVEAFIQKLKTKITIPIQRWDERLSTVSAHKALLNLGLDGKKRKGVVDRVSAQFILEDYLTWRKTQKNV